MFRRLGLAVLALTTGITGTLIGAGPAGAAVACGSTITTNTTLTTDLTCPNTALFIGADNVVLDLGGHTLTGNNPPESFFAGVQVVTGRTNAVIRNGTIRRFNTGITIRPGADRALVTGLTLEANGLGITAQTDTGTGAVAQGAQIVANTIRDTTRFSGMQLGGHGHRVEANTVSNGANAGIFLFGNDNLIVGNTIVDSGASGILINTTPNTPGPFLRNQLLGNRVLGSSRVFNSSSISIRSAADALVQGNSVTGRRSTPGVFVEESARTAVSSNRFDQNGSGVTVRGNSTETRIGGNVALANGTGIVVQAPATATTVDGNTAMSNTFDGIFVGAPATTVSRNSAVRNGDYGIEAVNGVTDGGGNTATGNGRPAQCTPNIKCS